MSTLWKNGRLYSGVLIHYGVKGMKWRKKKAKEVDEIAIDLTGGGMTNTDYPEYLGPTEAQIGTNGYTRDDYNRAQAIYLSRIIEYQENMDRGRRVVDENKHKMMH